MEFDSTEIKERALEALKDNLEDDVAITEAFSETYLPASVFTPSVVKGQIAEGQKKQIIAALNSDNDDSDVNRYAWSIIKRAIRSYLTPDDQEVLETLTNESSL